MLKYIDVVISEASSGCFLKLIVVGMDISPYLYTIMVQPKVDNDRTDVYNCNFTLFTLTVVRYFG